MENRTEDRELLAELLRYEKKEVRHARISSFASIVLAAVLVVAVAVTVPRAVETVRHAEETLSQVDAFLEETDGLVEEVHTLVENTNAVIVNNTDAVTEAVTKLNGVDFDSLNQAIQDLADAVAPLARVGRIFGS